MENIRSQQSQYDAETYNIDWDEVKAGKAAAMPGTWVYAAQQDKVVVFFSVSLSSGDEGQMARDPSFFLYNIFLLNEHCCLCWSDLKLQGQKQDIGMRVYMEKQHDSEVLEIPMA